LERTNSLYPGSLCINNRICPSLKKTADRYYQLTVSDEFWQKNGRDYGQYYLGIDGKYDLNIDRAPVLSIIVENKTKHATPLAFGKTRCNRLILITG